MAISKTQNERPAIIELVDAVNAMGDVSGQFDLLTRTLSATNAQVLALTNEVDELDSLVQANRAAIARIDGEIETIDLWREDWQAFASDFRHGETETLTIPASDSYSSTLTFEVPFVSSADCIVILQVITSDSPTLFEVSLTDSTYSGFSYQITNSDTDAHDVKLGYVAIRTNRD
jgi:hypothetical protein